MQKQTKPRIHEGLLTFKRPSDHSTFSPSSAERWLGGCAYSLQASKDIPNETSTYSEEGTVAHSVCEAVFRQEFFMVPFPSELSMAMMKYDSQEMMECAYQYVEVVSYWLKNKDQIGDVIHYGLEMGIPVFPEEGCFGTGDCIIIGTKSAVVIDFKYGKGKSVNANTTQLKVYAAGIARHLLDVPQDYKIFTVIHQPRIGQEFKEHSWTMPELNECLGDIWKAIQESKRSDLQPIEGNHCFWCPASRTKDVKLMCSVKKERPLRLAKENFSQFMSDMNTKSGQEVSSIARDNAILKIMALMPLMKKVSEDGEEEFLMRLQSGEAIPGCRVVEQYGRRTLNADTDKDIEELIKSKFPKVNVWKVIPESKKIRTVTELEKELGKNKLDPICIKKVSKKLDIMDDKVRAILGEMSTYASMIQNNNIGDLV